LGAETFGTFRGSGILGTTFVVAGAIAVWIGSAGLEVMVVAGGKRFSEGSRLWHAGQMGLATILMVLFAALGGGAVLALIAILTSCGDAWRSACSVAIWPVGIIGAVYELAAIVVWPLFVWWDWFARQADFKTSERLLVESLLEERRKIDASRAPIEGPRPTSWGSPKRTTGDAK
jgi:hypothetical protein